MSVTHVFVLFPGYYLFHLLLRLSVTAQFSIEIKPLIACTSNKESKPTFNLNYIYVLLNLNPKQANNNRETHICIYNVHLFL